MGMTDATTLPQRYYVTHPTLRGLPPWTWCRTLREAVEDARRLERLQGAYAVVHDDVTGDSWYRYELEWHLEHEPERLVDHELGGTP